MPQAAPQTRRLFLGLGLPQDVGARLESRVLPTLTGPGGEVPPGRTIYPARDLHLTFVFLGEFPEAARSSLERALADELRGLWAPELSIVGTGAFPDPRRARVLWAGIEERDGSAGHLAALRNRSWQAALPHGWRPSRTERGRPFRPHLTLARQRRGAAGDLDDFFALALDQPWLPGELSLYESRPGQPQGRHRVLASVPLAPRAG